MPKATVNVAVHVSLETHAAITKRAQLRGLSTSKYILGLIDKDLERKP